MRNKNTTTAGARTHTPGPWTVERDSENHWQIVDTGGYPRAEVYSAHRSTEARKAEALANANLIAAAPDLFDTLKDLVKCIRNFELGDYSPLMDEIFDAEHAIRKAEGPKEIDEPEAPDYFSGVPNAQIAETEAEEGR